MPVETQLSPVYAIFADDFDNDRFNDVLIGGNKYLCKPQTGIYDAGYGLLIRGTNAGKLRPVPADSSGFYIKGQVRDLKELRIKDKKIITVARNNDKLGFFSY